ncbi:RIP metalloprotease RseP [soil metagenome]
MEQAFGIFMMLAILSTLIIVHECGHFLVARFFGFQTPVFGFGLPFGPSWTVGKRWNTEFRIHACMLGGYVAIPELGDESNASSEVFGVQLSPFKKFPIWQRALVAVAGVTFNVLFAYLVMLIMMTALGQPIVQGVFVGELPAANPIAATAGVQTNDELIGVDDKKIKTPEEFIAYLATKKLTPIVLHVKRESQPLDLSMTPNKDGKVGMGLSPKVQYVKIKGGPIDVATIAATELTTQTGSMVNSIGGLFQGVFNKIVNPQAKSKDGKPQPGIESFHGVIAVVKIGADFAKEDWRQLFMFTILISMDLAIVNLLPWPALDGGHLAFMLLEALRGKPMEERAQGEIVKWGFLSLIALMVIVLVNDVSAWVHGDLDFKKKDPKATTSKPVSKSETPTETKTEAKPDIKADPAPEGAPQPASDAVPKEAK